MQLMFVCMGQCIDITCTFHQHAEWLTKQLKRSIQMEKTSSFKVSARYEL